MATLLVITVLLPVRGEPGPPGALPKLEFQTARSIALATALVTLGFSLILLWAFDSEVSGPQFAFVRGSHYGLEWLGRPGHSVRAGARRPVLWLFVLTSILMITSIAASWASIRENPGPYYAFLLALETGLLGLFASLDVVLFYIFFEFTLIPLFFLIGLWGGPQRRRAAVTFFLYTLAGSLLTLAGRDRAGGGALSALGGKRADLFDSRADERPGRPELGASGRARARWGSPQVLIFLLLLAGFAIKVPMFPFHTWLPLAHVEAPTAGSILLAGVLLKVGTYGLIRFNLGDDAARVGVAVSAAGDAVGHRDHLRRAGGAGADRHQAAGRVQLGEPHGVHRAGHLRAQLDGAGRRRRFRWSTTG